VEALARLPVGEVTATVAELPATPVLVGTTAVLSRAAHAGAGIGAVVFVDFDQHLLAPRYRAAEEAMALLARGARLVGGRSGGRVLVQTRQPRHPVLEAAVRGDPGRLVDDELALRTELQLPPVVALATLSGDTEVCAELAGRLEGRVEVTGPVGDRWLLRAPTHAALCDALAAAGRPAGVGNDRLRIDVDPLDV
jgi:primosomal protein N' (replication factor Y)